MSLLLCPEPFMIVLDLLQNLALLLATVVGYRVLLDRWQQTIWQQEALSGLVFGAVAVMGMLVPVHLSGGAILDGRSVILALAGAFGGPVVAGIAAVMAAGARILLGGTGVAVGVFAVAVSAAGGVVVFRRWSHRGELPSTADLWVLGIGVHLAMALAFLTLLGTPAETIIESAILLLLFVYPPLTVTAALLFCDYEKRRMEQEALVLEVARNQAFWDSMADCAVVVDGASRIRLLNPRGEELLGVAVDDVRNGSLHEVVHLVDGAGRALSPSRVTSLLDATGDATFGPPEELFVERPDGARIPVAVVARPVQGAQGGREGVLVVIRDRTAEHEAWQAVRASEERRELALDGGELGTWDWNLETGEAQTDQRCSAMLGYEFGELDTTLGGWQGRAHPDDVGTAMNEVARHVADPEGHPFEVRYRVRHRDGGWRWILSRGRVVEWTEDGTPLRMAGIQSDITGLVEAEARLAESEARFRRLVENAPDLIFRYRLKPDPGFDFVSPAATDIIGYSPDDHYADPELGLKIVHPDDLHLLTDVDGEATGDTPMKLRWVHKDGSVVWTEQHTTRIVDDEGDLVAIEGIARDVTDRHLADEEIRRLAEGLEDKVRERTAELSRANQELESFSYSVSHDLKAPLRAIDGYSALLEHDAPHMGDEARALVGEVRRNAARMAELIDGLLTFSRVGRGDLRRETVHVDELVRDLVDGERDAHPGHPVELVVGEIPAATGDPVLIRQALANVIGNAVKFSTPRAVSRLEVTGTVMGDSVRVALRDNGVGFDPRFAHKLFRVFERLHHDDEFPGSGVGLATVKRIVERHGGRVHIESELEVGTSVYLFLPRVDGAPPSPVEIACDSHTV